MPSTWKIGDSQSAKSKSKDTSSTPAQPTGNADQPPWHRGVDPYYLWAQHSQWRGFRVHAGWDRVTEDKKYLQIIACAKDEKMFQAAIDSGWLDVPLVYRQRPPGTKKKALHFTARLQFKDEGKLRHNELGLRWELALPLRDAERLALGSQMGLAGPTRSEVDFRATNLVAETVRKRRPLDHPKKIAGAIAVIDFGCPFLHHEFVSESGPSTRVLALWDQGSEVRSFPVDPKATQEEQEKVAEACRGWPWLSPQDFNYGRELGPKALQAMVAASRSTELMLDERDIYRGIDYLIDYDDPRRRVWYATHGAHVLDVAGGKVDPLQTREPPGHDPAARANLVFVQLPSLAAADGSGGALSAHLLDGVRYAMKVCEPDKPLAVNISYGAYAGPHDGSSLIERALDELLSIGRKNFAVVLAAGNARAENCHATRIVQHERSAFLRCSLSAGDTTDTFVEVWYARPSVKAQLQARVRAPNRQWSAWVEGGGEDLLVDDAREGAVVAMLRNDRWVPNGDRSLILLAIAPTAEPANMPGALADPGQWEIEIQVVGAEAALAGAIEVHAWLERDDPGAAAPLVKSFFVDQLANDDHNTLSSLATGQKTLVAGGFNRGTGRPALYSSIGPQRSSSQSLFLMAACEEDELQPTISAAAVRSGEVFRMNGTSVAAPVLTRRVFNHLSNTPATAPIDWSTELRKLVPSKSDDPAALKEAESD